MFLQMQPSSQPQLEEARLTSSSNSSMVRELSLKASSHDNTLVKISEELSSLDEDLNFVKSLTWNRKKKVLL